MPDFNRNCTPDLERLPIHGPTTATLFEFGNTSGSFPLNASGVSRQRNFNGPKVRRDRQVALAPSIGLCYVCPMAWLKGSLSAAFITLNTAVVCVLLYPMALLRLLLTGTWRSALTQRMDLIIDLWVSANKGLIRALRLIDIEVEWPPEPLGRHRWYMVVSNHQTWTDIILLQSVLRPALPPLKFFTKRELIWLPLVGLAMKLLGFPYVRRARQPGGDHSAASAAKDRDAINAACTVFRNHPTAVLSFLEGTRFTPAKRDARNSRFQHLLNPKFGGLSAVLSGLADQLDTLIDVTIHYPGDPPGFWDFLQGKCPCARMRVDAHRLTDGTRGPDPAAQRGQVGAFIEELWREKDARLGEAEAERRPWD